MEALANKYRPHTFEDVVSQSSIVTILKRQLELKKIKNCYLFCGPSGTGKTTLARILANEINEGQGTPIEIDAASNNGVDNIRDIISNANERALDCQYKVIICDEAHMITTAGWNSFLKCLEEPPKYTIFMFCTTDPQKIPQTILSRVMRFNLTKIPSSEIRNRLETICVNENFTNYNESIDYISKLANGGMRTAISYLEKVSDYSNDISIETTLKSLGNFSYKMMFDLTNAIIDKQMDVVISSVEDLYNQGNDLKLFIEQYLDFCLDLLNYCVLGSLECIKIPQTFKDDILYVIGEGDNKTYFSKYVDKLLDIKNTIKYDTNIKTTIEVMLVNMCRGI